MADDAREWTAREWVADKMRRYADDIESGAVKVFTFTDGNDIADVGVQNGYTVRELTGLRTFTLRTAYERGEAALRAAAARDEAAEVYA